MIRFERVSKIYPGGQKALTDVSFQLKRGDMVFLTGHSGAGKSTVLKLITVIERTNAGKVAINGHDIAKIKVAEVPYLRRDIGMIFQNPHLLMDRSVFDNIALPLVIEGFALNEVKKRVMAALDMVGLYGKERHYPVMLSGGEQQRVGIARAIINKPPLLLADEPTGNLDPKLSMDILHLFETLNAMGTTVLIATHDLGLIARMKYRTLTLKEGCILEHDEPSSPYDSAEQLRE